MKITQGWISNSSSCSFLIKVPNTKKKTRKDIIKELEDDIGSWEDMNKIKNELDKVYPEYSLAYLDVEYNAYETFEKILKVCGGEVVEEYN